MARFLSAIAILCLLAAFARADSGLQDFTCPSGYNEDAACAAACCNQNGGSYANGECEVNSNAQWSAAMACEQQSGCCVAVNGSQPANGGCCCATGLVLAGALVSAGLFARR